MNITWTENNTGIDVWLHGVTPIRFFYMLDNDVDWNELENGEQATGLNGANITYKFQFYKNTSYAIDLLDFHMNWTEFTVPLISSVSKSTTTSGATITWTTDVASNSSVEYGTSFSLGSIQSSSSSTTSHSITLSGLSSNTVYYFKVTSCTVDSCSEYPQYPYPLDSFTTQTSGDNNNNHGGSSGSSPSTTIVETSNLSGTHAMSSTTINDVVAKDGDIKTIIWKVKNTGTLFLNDCVLEARGDNPSWLNVGEVKDLAAGEEYDFVFKLNVPEGAGTGKHAMAVELVCKELTERQDFNVEITQEEIGFDLVRVERVENNKIFITYSLKELSGIDQEVKLHFVMFDADNNKVLEANDIRDITANSEQEFGLQIQVDKSLKGNLNLLVNINSETYSSLVQEDVFLAPVSGFSIFGENFNGTNLMLWGALAFVVGIITFFIIRQTMLYRAYKRKMNRIHLGHH